jgi:hypothetical protein
VPLCLGYLLSRTFVGTLVQRFALHASPGLKIVRILKWTTALVEQVKFRTKLLGQYIFNLQNSRSYFERTPFEQNFVRPKVLANKTLFDQKSFQTKLCSTKSPFKQNFVRPKVLKNKTLFDQKSFLTKLCSTKSPFEQKFVRPKVLSPLKCGRKFKLKTTS